MRNIQNNINNAKKYISDADAILITAGAGMGVDSGLPDFRGRLGFWEAYPPLKNLSLSFEDIANPKWFSIDPKLAWAFYGHRLDLYRNTIPHYGFKLLLDLVKKKNDNYFIFTSNVDGQFQKAGFDPEKIYEVHGNINNFQCNQFCTGVWEAYGEKIIVDMDKFQAKNCPKCKTCGHIARPNILMFNDSNFDREVEIIQQDKMYFWLQKIMQKNQKLVIIEIGAGIAIPTVRIKGEMIAEDYNAAKIIRINPKDINLNGELGVVLPYDGITGLKLCLDQVIT